MVYSVDEIKKIAVPIAKSYGVDSLSLFGSYARGEATSESDIDFLKNRLREYLPGKLDYYSELMGVRHNGYKVTSARKRLLLSK